MQFSEKNKQNRNEKHYNNINTANICKRNKCVINLFSFSQFFCNLNLAIQLFLNLFCYVLVECDDK